MNNELTQGEVLHILQNSNSVPLGTAIWNSIEEYNKLAKIVKEAVKYTAPRELTDEEYAGIGLHLFRAGESTSIKDGIRLVKLIIELTNSRKAQEK